MSIREIKSCIKMCTAEGRAKRAHALTLSGWERYGAQAEARKIGQEARCLQMAYTLLRGHSLSKCEHARTRLDFSTTQVEALLEAHYTPHEGVAELKALKQEVRDWSRNIQLRLSGYHE